MISNIERNFYVLEEEWRKIKRCNFSMNRHAYFNFELSLRAGQVQRNAGGDFISKVFLEARQNLHLANAMIDRIQLEKQYTQLLLQSGCSLKGGRSATHAAKLTPADFSTSNSIIFLSGLNYRKIESIASKYFNNFNAFIKHCEPLEDYELISKDVAILKEQLNVLGKILDEFLKDNLCNRVKAAEDKITKANLKKLERDAENLEKQNRGLAGKYGEWIKCDALRLPEEQRLYLESLRTRLSEYDPNCVDRFIAELAGQFTRGKTRINNLEITQAFQTVKGVKGQPPFWAVNAIYVEIGAAQLAFHSNQAKLEGIKADILKIKEEMNQFRLYQKCDFDSAYQERESLLNSVDLLKLAKRALDRLG